MPAPHPAKPPLMSLFLISSSLFLTAFIPYLLSVNHYSYLSLTYVSLIFCTLQFITFIYSFHLLSCLFFFFLIMTLFLYLQLYSSFQMDSRKIRQHCLELVVDTSGGFVWFKVDFALSICEKQKAVLCIK
jgi:hypothetical protein